MFAGQVIVGGVLSMTVITAVQEFDPPRSSTTVSVTWFVPLGYGPGGLSVRLTMAPSGSNDPLSTSAAGTMAWQLAFAFVVTLRHCAMGGVFVVTIVTLNEQVFVLFAVSRAKQLTVVAPTGNAE